MVVGSNPTRLATSDHQPQRSEPNPTRRRHEAARTVPGMLRLHGRVRTAKRHRPADRVFIAVLVIGFLAIALLLVTIYPSPMHLLRIY
jgi:hypothetical protein